MVRRERTPAPAGRSTKAPPERRLPLKVFSSSITLSSDERTEVWDITKLVREAVQQFPVSAGIALVNTLHTTCTVFVNEFQSALVDDLKSLIERLVPSGAVTVTTTLATRTVNGATPTPTSGPPSSAAVSPLASTTAS